MWFNPPVPVEHHAGEVGVLLVNERIVEQPWVFAALPPQPPLRVLDVGGSESTVALSLATLGHSVDVVDPRGYPLTHPNLRAHALPPRRARQATSTGTSPSRSPRSSTSASSTTASTALTARADVAAIAQLRGLADRLVLTVPFGPQAEIAGFERIYDEPGLAELLDGWDVQERLIVQRTDQRAWERCDQPAGRAVAMVIATPQPR